MIALGACRDGESPGSPEVDEVEAQVREVAAPDDSREPIVIAVRSLPTTLDPIDPLDPWGQRIVDDLLFEGLTRADPSGAPWASMALAERCEVQDVGRGEAVACRMRTDARFHDGAPVTIDDVLYSLSLWTDRRAGELRRDHGLGSLAAVERGGGPEGEDDRWVTLRFSASEPLALERIAAMKIVPERLHRNAEAFAAAPVGSGPLKLSAQSEEQLVLERAFDRGPSAIILRVYRDGAEALSQARRGVVHVIPELARVHIPDELTKPAMAARFQAFVVTPARYDLLVYNTREAGLKSQPLRAVIDAVIPREAIAEQVHHAPTLVLAAPVDTRAPAEIDLAALAAGEEAGLDPVFLEPPLGDEARARIAEERRIAADAALTALDWPLERGFRRRSTGHLRIPLLWDGADGAATATVQLLRDALRGLGIPAPSVTASWAYLQKPLRAGTFDAALMRLSLGDQTDLTPYFHSRGDQNFTSVADPELDAALSDYRVAETPAQRQAARARVIDRLAALRVVSVLYAPIGVTLISRRIAGLEFVDDLPRLDRLELHALARP
ncbi:MAG: hypothetical protein KC636_25685 [Myxococcales bacterium]|nr:hypothetical protein [Myxococcales bacterium]